MKIIFPLALFMGTVTACSNKNGTHVGADGLPSCISKQIEAFNKKDMANPPIQIDEFTYKGKRTFLFTADCCDQYNTLYNENCEVICSPSGGLDGGGDHKCKDFAAEGKLVKQVWKKKE